MRIFRYRRQAIVLAIAMATIVVGSVPGVAAEGIFRKDIQVETRAGGTLDAAYFRPTSAAPGELLPVVVMPHGGGGRRDCPGDVATAERYASRGYVAVLYTARGHGLFPPGPLSDCEADAHFPPDGIYDVFGPHTITDLYDVLAAVIEDEESHADRSRVGLKGYSQGGGTTNLGIAWNEARGITDTKPGSQPWQPNPYDIDIDAAAPGHTFYDLYRSLAPNECFKLSFGALLLGAYYSSNGAVIDPYWWSRWGAAFVSGSVAVRDAVRPDFELRSPKTYEREIDEVPSLWVQAFDDTLFPVDEAVDRFEEASGPDRLWLSWGGHAAPATNVSKDELAQREAEWEGWFDHYLKGSGNGAPGGPKVTYWVPDPDDLSKQTKMTAPAWPPPRAKPVRFALGSSGRLGESPPEAGGETYLLNDGTVQALSSDPIVSAVPMGASLPPSARTPANTAVFTSDAFGASTLLTGAPRLEVPWTSSGTEFQVNALLWDVYPDGTRRLLSRGCTLVPATPGEQKRVSLDLFHTAGFIAPEHKLELWVTPVDQPTFLASHVRSLNVLALPKEDPATLTLPLQR